MICVIAICPPARRMSGRWLICFTVEARCAQSESIRAPQQVTAIVGTLLPSSVYYNAPLVFLAG
jgi:hypothetical protein